MQNIDELGSNYYQDGAWMDIFTRLKYQIQEMFKAIYNLNENSIEL